MSSIPSIVCDPRHDALSAFIDGDRAVGELLRQQTTAAIPVIVLGEFRYGIAGSRHRNRYE